MGLWCEKELVYRETSDYLLKGKGKWKKPGIELVDNELGQLFSVMAVVAKEIFA